TTRDMPGLRIAILSRGTAEDPRAGAGGSGRETVSRPVSSTMDGARGAGGGRVRADTTQVPNPATATTSQATGWSQSQRMRFIGQTLGWESGSPTSIRHDRHPIRRRLDRPGCSGTAGGPNEPPPTTTPVPAPV